MEGQWLQELMAADTVLVQLPLLLVFAAVAHLLLGALFRRLHSAAEGSEGRWDDVIVSSLEAPLRTVLWVVVIYVGAGLVPFATGFQAFYSRLFQMVWNCRWNRSVP